MKKERANTLSIPDHKGRVVKRGTLKELIASAGIEEEVFLKNL